MPVTSLLPPQHSSAPEKCHQESAPPTCLSFIFDYVSVLGGPGDGNLFLGSWHRKAASPHFCETMLGPPQYPSTELVLL